MSIMGRKRTSSSSSPQHLPANGAPGSILGSTPKAIKRQTRLSPGEITESLTQGGHSLHLSACEGLDSFLENNKQCFSSCVRTANGYLVDPVKSKRVLWDLPPSIPRGSTPTLVRHVSRGEACPPQHEWDFIVVVPAGCESLFSAEVIQSYPPLERACATARPGAGPRSWLVSCQDCSLDKAVGFLQHGAAILPGLWCQFKLQTQPAAQSSARKGREVSTRAVGVGTDSEASTRSVAVGPDAAPSEGSSRKPAKPKPAPGNPKARPVQVDKHADGKHSPAQPGRAKSRSPRGSQCFRCQQFADHKSSQCTAPEACRNCAGSHRSSACPDKSAVRCALCGGKHRSTDYAKCERAPDRTSGLPTLPPSEGRDKQRRTLRPGGNLPGKPGRHLQRQQAAGHRSPASQADLLSQHPGLAALAALLGALAPLPSSLRRPKPCNNRQRAVPVQEAET